MNRTLHLIMPMGGAGTRFFNDGFVMPKPLIKINEKPFFYWATKSVSRFVEVADITFVVLKQHVEEFKINEVILSYFPDSRIEVVDWEEVKDGPVMTCIAGLRNINDDLPVLFNDCDHMFSCSAFVEDVVSGDLNCEGALLTFESDMPQFSYIEYEDGKIVGTVEKKVVSNNAICGAYLVSSASLFKELAEEYLTNCNYSEFFVSGIYNVMCKRGLIVKNYNVDFHIPFGTPTEYEEAQKSEYFTIIE